MEQVVEGDEVEPATEQRRLRHLTEVLVRNLTIPAASIASGSSAHPTKAARTSASAFYSTSSSGRAASPSGPSTSGERLQALVAERPLYHQRRSKDDLDLYLPSSQKVNTFGRRKNTVSRVTDLSASLEELPTESDHPPLASPVNGKHNIKGKGRASDTGQAISTTAEALNGRSPRTQLLDEVEAPPQEDTDLVYGWTAADPPVITLQRSRSKSSLKSQSSKRSIATVSKRLFQHNRRRKGAPATSDDEEPDSTSDSDAPRRPSTSREHSSSISGPHVSFQMSTDGWAPHGLGLGANSEEQLESAKRRARSASRGSILSAASGSSASTIRAPPPKPSEKEERYLRQKRYEDIRAHLVRSRLLLALPSGTDDEPMSSAKRPHLSRTRTISLPLRNEVVSPSTGPAPSNTFDRSASHQALYISPPHKKSMEPAFPLDISDTGSACRRHRFIVQIWVEEVSLPQEEKEKDKSAGTEWKLLLEWEVDLRKLVSLGTDPRLFPSNLPANTLIFRLSNTDEYLTARLPSFILADIPLNVQSLLSSDQRTADYDGISGGHVSDPGPRSSSPIKQGLDQKSPLAKDTKRERERLLARRKMIIDRSVRETRMLQSVDDMQLREAIEKEQEATALRLEVSSIRFGIDKMLMDEPFVSQHAHDDKLLKARQYEQDKTDIACEISSAEAKRAEKHASLELRLQRLSEARQLLRKRQMELEQSRHEYQQDDEVFRSIQLSASQRRAALVADLSTIFPVDLVDASNVLFSICGLPLPNGDFETQQNVQRTQGLYFDDDHISSALGYVAQAVQLLAAYLRIPLYYPVRCMGSRSLVQDPISQMKGPKIFPLYARGVDKYRFEYAVFLLNKDIEQIMLEYHLGVVDLTQTLPNLKNLYLILSSDATTKPDTSQNGPPAAPRVLSTSVATTVDRHDINKHTADENLDSPSLMGDAAASTADVNGSIVSISNETSTSTLEKILSNTWGSYGKTSSQPSAGRNSPTKSKKRYAETSRTMTLLGGRTSASNAH